MVYLRDFKRLPLLDPWIGDVRLSLLTTGSGGGWHILWVEEN
jgi:hypothetical protein